jgi:lipoprotein LpqH
MLYRIMRRVLGVALPLMSGGLLACSLVACSSPPQPTTPRSGELPAGMSEVGIAGQPLVTSELVRCSPAGTQTTIVTGKEGDGTISTIDSTDGLAARSVEVRNVDGFTGSYWQGLGDAPTVVQKGRTFLIEGSAMGFDAKNPSARVSQKYSIRVAC